jgi:hypothetical protein
MSYQQSSGTPRGFDRPKKAKAKKTKTQHTLGSRQVGRGAQTLKEVVDRAITGFDTLGSQTFAMSPFSQHFDTWLKSLSSVLDDFETSKVIEVDDKFREERTELFSAVEAALKAEQAKEASREAAIMGLHGSKDLLFHAEQEHEKKLREYAARREAKLKGMTNSINALRAEVDAIQESKAGFLERFTKSKAKIEEDSRWRLSAAEKVLDSTKSSFAEELTSLQKDYDREKGMILEKVASERKEVDRLVAEAEIDGSVEVRHVACDELAEAVKALVKRADAPVTEKSQDD